MKKSLLLLGALAAMMTANAQEAPKPILQDVTPWGYNFDNYEDGAMFKVHSGTGNSDDANANFWTSKPGIYDREAAKKDGHFTTLVWPGNGNAAINTDEKIAEDNAGFTIHDFGGYLGKCLVINQPWSPLNTATAANPVALGANKNRASTMGIGLYCDKDSIQHDWAGRAIRVRLVLNIMRRGCHTVGTGEKGLRTAFGFSEIIADDNNGTAGGWYRPGSEYVNNDLIPEVQIGINGSEFAKWENEGTCVAEIPAEIKPIMNTEQDPYDNPGHACAAGDHYHMQLDRFMVYEWDVYMHGPLENLKVNLTFDSGNLSIIIKEIKFFNITNARDLLIFPDPNDGTNFTYGPNSLLEKRQKSWRYYTEKGVKEFAEGAGDEPGDDVDLTEGKYFIRNTQTGYYLSQGHSWGTMAVLKQPAARTYEFEAVDGGYKIKSVMGYLKGGGEIFVDGGNANAGGVFGIEKAGDHYYIKQGDKFVTVGAANNYQSTDQWNYDFWLMENTNYILNCEEAEATEGSLWDIVSYDDMVASLADATEENPVDATFFVKGHNVEKNDPEVGQAWIWTKNGKKTELILGGREWSDKKDWHAQAPYIWCINEGDEAVAGEDVLAQDIEGLPAGKYEATYRLVNQSNTPLVVKFNNTEATAYEKEGDNLWYTDAMEHLHKNECKATFTVGEDGKLAVKFIKTVDPAQQNRFAFKSLALKYMGEVEAEQDGLTAETAWQISTPEDIEAMKDKVSNAAPTYFKLMNDIDMTGVNHVPAVGSGNADFGKTIHFDGNNHVISNLTSVAENEEFYYASLFGVFQGSVKNLGLVDVNLKSALGVAGIGGYVGYGNVELTTVDNCFVTGKMESLTAYAAGLMGTNDAPTKITNSYAQVDVKGKAFAGGIIGRGRKPVTLNNCYVSGTVAGEGKVNLVATTDKTGDAIPALTCENVVALNTGATTMTNYGEVAGISTDANAIKTWAAFNEGKLFNELPALNWQNVEGSGIDEIEADDVNAPVEYYNLQGIRVENPANGLYIKKQGNKATKVLVR